MAVRLDPTNPTANFTIENAKNPPSAILTPGPVLRLSDPTADDLITLFAPEPDITAGKEIELTVNFAIDPGQTLQGADTGVRFTINDGAKAIYAVCILKNGVKGIALASGIDFPAAGNYLASSFVAVDWNTPSPPTPDGRITLKLRRTTQGTAQIVEVNGVAPQPPVELLSMDLPAPQRPRAGPTVEFGCSSVESKATISIARFETNQVQPPVDGQLVFRQLRIRDSDSTDRLRFRADFTLGASSNGIDPTAEPVTIKLSNGAGAFYERTLSGFSVHGQAPRRHWKLTDAARAASGIEQLVIKEDSATEGSIVLRDLTCEPAVGADYSTVTAEITIGAAALAGGAPGGA